MALAVAGQHADAAPSDKSTSDEPPLSFGYTNSGRLIGGKLFRDTPFMSRVQVHKKSKVSFALPNLLSVLSRAARTVARKYPGSVLEVGELSRKDGGRITSHLSHQSGRDADVGFYLTDLDGGSIRAPRFLRCDGHGEGKDDPTIRFDDQRNWEFVRAVLEDPNEEVRQIFIYAPLRARLLAYAAKVKAPRQLRAKAAAAMMQPVNALPHDDHFHIRISCPLDQLERGCADLPLWRAPGSPDEFGPEILAGSPRQRWSTPISGVPLEDWGGMARLWSVERGVCATGGLTCGGTPTSCEDLGDPTLAASFPRAIFEPVPSPDAPGEGRARDENGVATVAGSRAALPADAFSDEGPGVAAEAIAARGTGQNADSDGTGNSVAMAGTASATAAAADSIEPMAALAAVEIGMNAQRRPSIAPLLFCPTDAAAFATVSSRAKSSYCSYEEPNACECPVAALGPSAEVDAPTYRLAGPSLVQ